MEAAIPKLDRRIADLESFNVDSVADRSDARIDALERSLDALLVSVFGAGTVEYNRYHWQVTRLDAASINMMHRTLITKCTRGFIVVLQLLKRIWKRSKRFAQMLE